MSSNQSKAGTVGLGTGIPGYLPIMSSISARLYPALHVVGASTLVSWHTADALQVMDDP